MNFIAKTSNREFKSIYALTHCSHDNLQIVSSRRLLNIVDALLRNWFVSGRKSKRQCKHCD